MMQQRYRTIRLRIVRGFTLTELLVAIALLIVVMLAVSTIFGTTGRTIGTGTAVTELTRRLSMVRGSLYSDICGESANPYLQGAGMLPVNGPVGNRPPFLLIRSQRKLGFLNKEDRAATGGVMPPYATYWNQGEYPRKFEYRQDMLGMFVYGQFRRQTGGTAGGAVVPARQNQNSDLAYVWYGHLWQPDRNGQFAVGNPPVTYPGEGTAITNPRNYFASQWVLGRMALLMFEPQNVTAGAAPNPNAVQDNYLQSVWYYGRPDAGYPARNGYGQYTYHPLATPETTGDVRNGLLPLEDFVDGRYAALATDGTVDGGGLPIYSGYAPVVATWGARLVEGRYDAIGTHTGMTWDDYATMLASINNPADPVHYWFFNWNLAIPTRPNAWEWAENRLSYRFQGRLDSDVAGLVNEDYARRLSQNVPVLVAGCPRFIVEFAGDFIAQDPATGLIPAMVRDGAGNLVALDYHHDFGAGDYVEPQTDGVIDFNVVDAGLPTERRSIRWYGSFRNEDGTAVDAAQLLPPSPLPGWTVDNTPPPANMPIAPVYYSRRDGMAAPQRMPFEQVWPTTTTPDNDVYTNCWTQQEMAVPTLAPRLIRITVQFVDTDGRLQDGMTQQYVFPVRFN